MDVLSNKQYKNYSYFSRYTSFPIYYNKEDKKYVYGTSSPLNKDVNYVLHKVKKGDTLDTLALTYYNNPTYYWIIGNFNDIQDAYSKLIEDSTLMIPVLSDISFKE